jgi:hypothetical protein
MDDRESHFKMKMNNYTPDYQVSNIRFLHKLRPRAPTVAEIGMNIGLRTLAYN